MPTRLILMSLLLGLIGCVDSPTPPNPSFPISFSTANSALDKMAATPHPLARPLLIIGGFLDPNVSPPLYKLEFHRLTGDDRIITASVGFCGSFDECRRCAIDAVQQAYPSDDPNWTTEVDVVGASMGGLIARVAAAPSTDPSHPRRLKVARMFTISSPHSGATLAALGFTSYHKDALPGSAFMQQLAKADADATYELFPYVCLGDELVGQQNAAPPGRMPIWLANPPLIPSHASAMVDPRIRADIARRLRGEEPFSKLPTTPLPQ
jgi:hypothetical protein